MISRRRPVPTRLQAASDTRRMLLNDSRLEAICLGFIVELEPSHDEGK